MADDDELVREVVMMSLMEAGFVTEGAEDARSALVYLDQGEVIDAQITDFSMPCINGLDLIREVRRRRPTTPAILLTGHVGDIAETRPARRAIVSSSCRSRSARGACGAPRRLHRPDPSIGDTKLTLVATASAY